MSKPIPAPIAAPDRMQAVDPAILCDVAIPELGPVLKARRAFEFCDPLTCQTVVNVGLFFDGTNNNMERDYKRPAPSKRYHSNIVRLHNAYPDEESNAVGGVEKFYRFYMPGVGTPFPQIREYGEETFGRAFAKGGQARILWGVLQVYNAIHKAVFENASFLTDDEMAEKIKDYENKVDYHQKDGVFPDDPALDRKGWFAKLTRELTQKLEQQLALKPKPAIPLVSLSVFGFSRGAVQARAFCYWFQDALQDGKFAGIETEIRFLGLFDSVATVGSSDSINKTTPLAEWMVDGHSGWAAEILKSLPKVVQKTVHYIAAHEQRMNFPVTRVKGNNVEEVLYPGMHSDVGGGYGAGAQGKARNGLSSLMSQIPLLHMYKAALLAGVPLLTYDQLQGEIKEDLQVDPQMLQAWNRYMDWSGNKGGDFDEEVYRHYTCYFRWREQMLYRLEQQPFYLAGSPQDQADLQESNNRLKGDLVVARQRTETFASPYGGYERGNPLEQAQREKDRVRREKEYAQANLMQQRAAVAGLPLFPFEIFALKFFDQPQGVPKGAGDLLSDYVHDSLAGFYLAGTVTQLDKDIDTIRVCQARARGQTLNAWQKNLYEPNKEEIDQLAAQSLNCNWSKEDEEAGKRPPVLKNATYPVQTDEYVSDLRMWVIRVQSDSRREGGGYLRARVSFMPKG